MSKFNSFKSAFFASLLVICCKSQDIVSSRHFVVELYDDDYEFAAYTCQDDFEGHVASIRSQEEQDEINELIQNVDFSTDNIWIGYTDNGTGTHFWLDSSTSTYTNWCANEPNAQNEASCAQITSTGCWIDAPCGEYHYTLCRRGNIVYSSNSNYLVVEHSSLVHEDAQEFCRTTIGTDLATVTTDAEQAELLALIQSVSNYGDEFHIGLDDSSSEGTLVWQDGSTVDTTFVNNKLCNSNSANGDCVFVDKTDGCWYFLACNFFLHFACNAPRTTLSSNYVAVDARLSFLNANEYCKDEYSGTLATITSSAENTEVSGISYATSWIGYNDRDSEGNFVWVSGTGSYTNWRSGEPNNFGQGEDCTIIYRDQNPCLGCWNDIDCLDPRRFVCNL